MIRDFFEDKVINFKGEREVVIKFLYDKIKGIKEGIKILNVKKVLKEYLKEVC